MSDLKPKPPHSDDEVRRIMHLLSEEPERSAAGASHAVYVA